MKETLIANWDNILQHMKQEYSLSDVVFRTWILPLKVYSLEDHLITISVDETKVGIAGKSYLEPKYAVPLSVSFEEIMGEHFDIQFELAKDLREKEAAQTPSSNQKRNLLLQEILKISQLP